MLVFFSRRFWRENRFWIGGLLLLAAIGVFFIVAPPPEFPLHRLVKIEAGATLGEIASQLERDHVISSPLAFSWLVRLSGSETKLAAGAYLFNTRLFLWSVVRHLVRGDFGLPPTRVTIREGLSVEEIADLLDRALSDFNREEFVALAKPGEGYLFPDTYYFSPAMGSEEIIGLMHANFIRQLDSLGRDLGNTERSVADIVAMASLLEREAADWEDRRLIAGILWKRLDAGMPLQVDAVFDYLLGKNTFELTKDDLALDSPFNTYRFPGLPPTPIANPGREALLAAIYPTDSPYWFYLSDRQSRLHFSRSFAEHREKKAVFLP